MMCYDSTEKLKKRSTEREIKGLGVRKSCIDCCLKHLGQSVILFSEARKGYPMHKYIALGHLAEAEDETIAEFPNLAEKIRETRLSLERGHIPSYSIEDLIEFADEFKGNDKPDEDEDWFGRRQ